MCFQCTDPTRVSGGCGEARHNRASPLSKREPGLGLARECHRHRVHSGDRVGVSKTGLWTVHLGHGLPRLRPLTDSDSVPLSHPGTQHAPFSPSCFSSGAPAFKVSPIPTRPYMSFPTLHYFGGLIFPEVPPSPPFLLPRPQMGKCLLSPSKPWG